VEVFQVLKDLLLLGQPVKELNLAVLLVSLRKAARSWNELDALLRPVATTESI
jgi:hypothetical protein